MTEAPPSSAPHATTEPGVKTSGRRPRLDPRPAIVGAIFVAIIGLAIWYLVRPEPLLVQREAESTRIDIAARVPGRLVKIAAARGQNVEAGATLLVIDNPELIAEWTKPKPVADAELRRISVGTRPEIIAQRTAEIDRETADLTVAQQTYNLTKQLAADKFAPSPSSTSKDLAFLRVDGVTARRLAHLEKVYRLADA